MTLIRGLNTRGLVVPLVATVLLIVIATGAALAIRAPSSPAGERSDAQEQDAPPTAEELERVVQRLADALVDTDVATLEALAAEHGLGGAVRLLVWADASGKSVDDIAAMRAGTDEVAPMGWGRIARELNAADPDLDLHPGIGKIMGGGHGREEAPGQSEE